MKITTYSATEYHNFKRFLVTANTMVEIERMYAVALSLPLVDTIDYICAGLSLYFARGEDRTFFLMAYNERCNLS